MKNKCKMWFVIATVYSCVGLTLYLVYLHTASIQNKERIEQIAGNAANESVDNEQKFQELYEKVRFLESEIDTLKKMRTK